MLAWHWLLGLGEFSTWHIFTRMVTHIKHGLVPYLTTVGRRVSTDQVLWICQLIDLGKQDVPRSSRQKTNSEIVGLVPEIKSEHSSQWEIRNSYNYQNCKCSRFQLIDYERKPKRFFLCIRWFPTYFCLVVSPEYLPRLAILSIGTHTRVT